MQKLPETASQQEMIRRKRAGKGDDSERQREEELNRIVGSTSAIGGQILN